MNKLNVLYSVDNNYVQHLAASMSSACISNSKEVIDFYILGSGLSDDSVARLQRMEESFKCRVHVIEIDNFIANIEGGFDTKSWNEIIMARLFVARYLPQSVKRVLYLDADTIVNDSLAPLFAVDMSNYALGAVCEPTVGLKRKISLGLSADVPYFNSGVLLINLDVWRKENIEEKLLEICSTKQDCLVAGDQDALNIVFKGNVYLLPPCYNYANTFYFYPYRVIKKLVDPCPYYDELEYKRYISSPVIIHFLGEDRPWRRGSTHKYADLYWRCAKLSTFSDCLKDDLGWESYFKVWGAFNSVMKIAPGLRYKIINGLIPCFLKMRELKRKKR